MDKLSFFNCLDNVDPITVNYICHQDNRYRLISRDGYISFSKDYHPFGDISLLISDYLTNGGIVEIGCDGKKPAIALKTKYQEEAEPYRILIAHCRFDEYEVWSPSPIWCPTGEGSCKLNTWNFVVKSSEHYTVKELKLPQVQRLINGESYELEKFKICTRDLTKDGKLMYQGKMLERVLQFLEITRPRIYLCQDLESVRVYPIWSEHHDNINYVIPIDAETVDVLYEDQGTQDKYKDYKDCKLETMTWEKLYHALHAWKWPKGS